MKWLGIFLLLSSTAAAQELGISDRVRMAQAETQNSNDVSLRDYLQGQISQLRSDVAATLEARDKAYGERFASQQDAIAKANDATEKRFEGVNEFRAQLGDQAKTFASKDSLDSISARIDKVDADTRLITNRLIALEGLTTRIEINTKIIDNLGNRLTQLESSGSPVAVRAEQQITALSERLAKDEAEDAGKSAGLTQSWAIVTAVIGLIFGAIGAWAILHRSTNGKVSR